MLQVKQELRTEGSTLGLIRQFMHLHLNLEATDEELLTEDLILRDPTKNGSMNNGKGLIDGLKRKRYNNEEAPPCTSFRLHKRKGVPRQSPFYWSQGISVIENLWFTQWLLDDSEWHWKVFHFLLSWHKQIYAFYLWATSSAFCNKFKFKLHNF